MNKLRESTIRMNMVILVLGLLLCTTLCSAYINLKECQGDLGMESGAIKDEDINVRSTYNPLTVGPNSARLNKDVNEGAWCPKSRISTEAMEYLEISLPSLHLITAVATQGRFNHWRGLEFAEEYMLEYWRPGLPRFQRYKSVKGQEILKGNTNTYSVVKRKLDHIVFATWVRFIPYSVQFRAVCMRVEVYGCPWKDGLLSYSMRQGDKRKKMDWEIDLTDVTYDGINDHSYLHGGLGQLTDGMLGEDNFKQDGYGIETGYEWVGWKNEASYSRSIEIIFKFDQVRNFTAAYFYCSNMHTIGVQVFSSAKIWFSIGGKHFNGSPLNFSYKPDTFMEGGRNVTIHLYQRVGKFVKVELAFTSKWMMISEVGFDSVPAVGNFTEEDPTVAPTILSTAMSDRAITKQNVGLVIGILAAVILYHHLHL